jgi:uncharacterized membrane protein
MAYEPQLTPGSRALIRVVDNLVIRLARHWLLLANLFLLFFSGLPFLAPVLMHYGVEGPARLIYTAYSFTCHQLAYRTWFFFGAQTSYTVEQLQQHLGVTNSSLDLLYWRDLYGSPAIGYKMAYCERDVAIYSSMLAAGLVYALLRRRIRPLGLKWYLLFAILPMGIDGGTQLVMLRESTPLLRAITGILFGVLTVWLLYPYVEEAMQDTYSQSVKQLGRLSRREAIGPSTPIFRPPPSPSH